MGAPFLVASLSRVRFGDVSVQHADIGDCRHRADVCRALVAIRPVYCSAVGRMRAVNRLGVHAAHGPGGSPGAPDLGSECESYDCGRYAGHARLTGVTGRAVAGVTGRAVAGAPQKS